MPKLSVTKPSALKDVTNKMLEEDRLRYALYDLEAATRNKETAVDALNERLESVDDALEILAEKIEELTKAIEKQTAVMNRIQPDQCPF